MMLGCFIRFFKKLNQALWLSSQVRKQGHQLPKFHLLDHQPLLNMQRWDKKTQRHVLMCPYPSHHSGAINPLRMAQTRGVWDCPQSRGLG